VFGQTYHDRADRLVNWQLLPVDTQPGELSVRVGKVTALEKRIVAEPDTGHNVTSAKRNLLSLSKELIGVPVQLQFTNIPDGHKLFRPHLGGVKDIEIKIVLVGFRDDLNTELPLGKRAALDSHPEILAMEIGILASNLEGFVPYEAVDTKLWSEDKLDKGTLALGVDQCERVDTETLHHTVRARNSTIRHSPTIVHVKSVPVA
jgi:hypothetical protein